MSHQKRTTNLRRWSLRSWLCYLILEAVALAIEIRTTSRAIRTVERQKKLLIQRTRSSLGHSHGGGDLGVGLNIGNFASSLHESRFWKEVILGGDAEHKSSFWSLPIKRWYRYIFSKFNVNSKCKDEYDGNMNDSKKSDIKTKAVNDDECHSLIEKDIFVDALSTDSPTSSPFSPPDPHIALNSPPIILNTATATSKPSHLPDLSNITSPVNPSSSLSISHEESLMIEDELKSLLKDRGLQRLRLVALIGDIILSLEGSGWGILRMRVGCLRVWRYLCLSLLFIKSKMGISRVGDAKYSSSIIEGVGEASSQQLSMWTIALIGMISSGAGLKARWNDLVKK